MKEHVTIRSAQIVAIVLAVSQIMASAIVINLNANPSSAMSWMLFFEFGRPLYLLPMIDFEFIRVSPWSLIIFFVAVLFFIFTDIISRERYMTVLVLTGLLTTNIVIMLLMGKGLFTGYPVLSITPVSLKFAVMLVLSFYLYAGIRAIITQSRRGRLAVLQRLS